MWPNNNMHAGEWCGNVIRLLASWWTVDRIRVPPHEGKLARLACGTLLKINDEWFEIESRMVTAAPGSAFVTYECAAGEPTGPAERAGHGERPRRHCGLVGWGKRVPARCRGRRGIRAANRLVGLKQDMP